MNGPARVTKNAGLLKLLPDGNFYLEGWQIEGGGENMGLNIADALIALLQEKRPEFARIFDNAIVVPLRAAD